MFILEKWIVIIFNFCLFTQKIFVFLFFGIVGIREGLGCPDLFAGQNWEGVCFGCFLDNSVLRLVMERLSSWPPWLSALTFLTVLVLTPVASTGCPLLDRPWCGELMSSFEKGLNDHTENLCTGLPKQRVWSRFCSWFLFLTKIKCYMEFWRRKRTILNFNMLCSCCAL